jgi:hypothetical protein
MCSNISTDTTRSKRSLGVEIVHVGGDDLEVGQAALGGEGLDVLALGVGVGDGGDAGGRIMLRQPEGQAAPAAAQFQDVLAIRHAGALAGQGQGGGLRAARSVTPGGQ